MQEFELKFTEQEVNLVLGALGKLPLEQSLNLFSKIKTECENKLKKSNNLKK